MESLGNNHASSTQQAHRFTAADVFLRRNGFCIEVTGAADMNSSMDRWSATNFALPESSRGFASTASHSTSRII